MLLQKDKINDPVIKIAVKYTQSLKNNFFEKMFYKKVNLIQHNEMFYKANIYIICMSFNSIKHILTP